MTGCAIWLCTNFRRSSSPIPAGRSKGLPHIGVSRWFFTMAHSQQTLQVFA